MLSKSLLWSAQNGFRHWIDPDSEKNQTGNEDWGNHHQKLDSIEYGRHTAESREWKNTGWTMVTSVWHNLKLPPGKENHRRKWKLCKVQRQLMSWLWRVTTLIRDCGLGWWLKRHRQEHSAILLPSFLLGSIPPAVARWGYLLNTALTLWTIIGESEYNRITLVIKDVSKLPLEWTSDHQFYWQPSNRNLCHDFVVNLWNLT